MKKNLFFGLFATMMLLLTTACQKENDLLGNGEATISFEISTPQMATRAFSDGTTATQLQYAVYDEQGNPIQRLSSDANEFKPVIINDFNGKRTINIQLAAGKTYNVLFWAANEDAPYTIDFENLKMNVNYTGAVSNDERRDAFYCYYEVTADRTKTENVTLTRPFAQLNIGTNDFDKLDGVSAEKTSVKVDVFSTLNFVDGSVEGQKDDQLFALNAIPSANEKFPVDGYDYLAMNYLLVGMNKKVVDVEFSYGNESKTETRTFTGIPVMANYRTNIYGALLTNNIGFDVEIEEGFDGDANTIEDDLNVAAQLGGTYTLTGDVELTSTLNVTTEFTLDLNGKTISGAFVKGTDNALINIDNGAKLTIVGGVVENTEENGAATIRNAGNLVLNGVEIKGAPIADGSYPDYAVYTSGSLVVEEGTKISSDRGAINMQDGANVIINGGNIEVTDALGTRSLTAHVIYAYGSASKLTINDGNFSMKYAATGNLGASVICPAGATIKVYGGNFYYAGTQGNQSGIFQNYMGYGAPVDVYGGTYNDNTVTKNGNLAEGYVAVKNSDNTYSVVKGSVAANAAEFIAAVNNIEDGDVIALTYNVDFTTDNRTHNSGNYYDGLYYIGDKDFTIDLGGKTIGNPNGAVNDYLLNFKNDGTKANTITIKNGTIDAGTAAYCAICTSSTSAQRVTINLENVNIINNNSYGAAVKVRGGAQLNVMPGTKITGKDSYTCLEVVGEETEVNIYDGTEFYQNGKSSYVGSLIGASYGATVNVYGGKGVSKKSALFVYSTGGTINAKGGEWIGNGDGTVPAQQGDNNVNVLIVQNNTNESGYVCASIMNVTGGTYKGGISSTGYTSASDAQLHISGGNFNTDPSSYLADGKSATENDGVWTVQ